MKRWATRALKPGSPDFRSRGTLAQWLRDTIAASPGLAIDTLIERADHAGWGFKVTGPLAKIVRRNIADLDARGEINLTEERAAPTVNMRPTTAQCE